MSQNNQTSSKDNILHFILRIFIIGFVIFIISMFFFQVYFVSGVSMSPTLKDKQPVLLQKFNFRQNLERNDIVVIKADKVHTTIIKRIIGVPGDQIIIKDGIIYVNNSIFSEVADFPLIENPGNAGNTINLYDNQYFVVGDNRNNSIDSRFNDIGIIEQSSMIGKVIIP